MRYTRILHHERVWSARLDDGVDDEIVAHLLDGPVLTEGVLDTGRHVVDTVPLGSVALLPPVVPPVFYAVGLNYRRHIAHALEHGYDTSAVPTRPEVGYRANNALIGPGAAIVKPAEVSGRFEAEGELVAVVGRTLRRASRAEAQEAILGWTIGNDVSARDWQHADRTFWRSKNADTFKPMGPWIETDVDPMAQTTTVRVSGREEAKFPTGDMLFDPWDYLVEASRFLTIHPGDVLWLGADSTCQLVPGDLCEIEISGIGVLSNPVVGESLDATNHVQEGSSP